ncbi:MAG: hypothetical protein QOF48_1307 [Verrucomicrobiota bacterium]|jgi:hypothetical protein
MSKQDTLVRTALAVTALTALAFPGNASAQSSDALLNKLVDKGVLTSKEAEDLRKETQRDAGKETAKMQPSKIGLPDWVTALKFNGDFRGRYEGNYYDSPDAVTRDRLRYRVRLGMVATLQDHFEIGVRLASGDAASGFSTGNPLSASSTFQDNGSRKGIYLDLAYAKWTALHSADVTGSLTFGKMENPFAFTHNVFDPDYNPEGAAAQVAWKLSENQTLRGIAAGFVLDEVVPGTHDPYLLGAQVLWDAKWGKHLQTTLGGGSLWINSEQSLTNGAVPNINRGNTRTGPTGVLAENFNPLIADASVTYTLDSFPGYKGAFPIRGFGEYLNNVAIDSNNEAYLAGITFGKAAKKGTWEFTYQYRNLDGNSWYEEFPDDDFGGFYHAGPPSSATGAGFGPGTNVRGHYLKAVYALYDSLTLGVTYYRGQLINEVPNGSKSTANHLLVDLIWKF